MLRCSYHIAVLDGAGKALEVLQVPHTLKVAAADEEVNLGAVLGFQLGNRLVDAIQLAV